MESVLTTVAGSYREEAAAVELGCVGQSFENEDIVMELQMSQGGTESR